MIVVSLTENEDGSANLDLELTAEEKQYLIEEGFISIVKKGIEYDDTGRTTRDAQSN